MQPIEATAGRRTGGGAVHRSDDRRPAGPSGAVRTSTGLGFAPSEQIVSGNALGVSKIPTTGSVSWGDCFGSACQSPGRRRSFCTNGLASRAAVMPRDAVHVQQLARLSKWTCMLFETVGGRIEARSAEKLMASGCNLRHRSNGWWMFWVVVAMDEGMALMR